MLRAKLGSINRMLLSWGVVCCGLACPAATTGVTFGGVVVVTLGGVVVVTFGGVVVPTWLGTVAGFPVTGGLATIGGLAITGGLPITVGLVLTAGRTTVLGWATLLAGVFPDVVAGLVTGKKFGPKIRLEDVVGRDVAGLAAGFAATDLGKVGFTGGFAAG